MSVKIHREPVWRSWWFWISNTARFWAPLVAIWTTYFVLGFGYHAWHTGWLVVAWGTIATVLGNLPGIIRVVVYPEWKRHLEGRDR